MSRAYALAGADDGSAARSERVIGGGALNRYDPEANLTPQRRHSNTPLASRSMVVVLGVAIFLAARPAPSVPPTGPPTGSAPPTTPPSAPSPPACRGQAACFDGTVTHIVDGDTLDVGGTRIRLALVNSPEVGQPGADTATAFTASTCPVGTSAHVDEDDGQTGGSYGRMIALVTCGGVNLNAALLTSGNAVLVPYYCSVSEFAADAWTGCS